MTICPRCAKNRASIHTCTPTEYAWGLESELARLHLIEAGARDSEELVRVLTALNAALNRDHAIVSELYISTTEQLHFLEQEIPVLREELTASRAEAAQAQTTLKDVLYTFTTPGHPGRPCMSSGWVSVEMIAKWRDALFSNGALQWLQENYIPRSEVEELKAWQVAIAEGIGFINRAEGQSGYEVADPQTILDHFRDWYVPRDEVEAMQREAVERLSQCGKLAKRLQGQAYYHGGVDQVDCWSDKKYRDAADNSDKALESLLDALEQGLSARSSVALPAPPSIQEL